MQYVSSIILTPHPKDSGWRSDSFEGKIRYVYQNQLFCDAVVTVRTKMFWTHKCILAAHSPILKEIFFGHGTSSWWAAFSQFDTDGFERVLGFIYKVPSSNLSKELRTDICLLQAYSTARTLDMQKIKKEIFAIIVQGMRWKERFWRFLETSLNLKLHEIVTVLLNFASFNSEKILSGNNFLKSKRETLNLVFSLENLSISESKLLESIGRWQNFNKLSTGDPFIQNLLSRVPFKKLSVEDFVLLSAQHQDLIGEEDRRAILRHFKNPTKCALPWGPFEETKLDSKIVFAKYKAVQSDESSGDNWISVLEKGDLADVRIFVGSQKIAFNAHRFLLALGSEYFVDMLYDAHRKTAVEIPDEDPKKFENFLKYFYGNFEEKLKSNSLSSVLLAYDLARKYGFHALEGACAEYFKTVKLTPDAYWLLLEHERTLPQCTVNVKEITKYAQVQTKWILADESFLRAPKSSLVQFLQNDYFSASEYDILCRIAQWLKRNQIDFPKDEAIKEIWESIRLQNLTAEELDQILVSYDNLFSEEDTFAIRSYQFHPSQSELPDWCYKGARGLLFEKISKIGTVQELKYAAQACRSTNTVEANYTTRISKNDRNYFIQYLELSWELTEKKIIKNSSTTCNVLIKFKDSKRSVNFIDIDISKHVRLMVPVGMKMNAENPKVQFSILITISTPHKIHFLKQNSLNVTDMEIVLNSGKCCISDFVVNGTTSEDVHVPRHILYLNRNKVTSTDAWCK